MTVSLDHILVPAHDREVSARFVAEVLGAKYLGLGSTAGPPAFAWVQVGETTLDFADTDSFRPQHYAFRVGEEEFDAILVRVQDAGLSIYADPGHGQEGQLNNWNGGRGFYFSDPNDDHKLELLTQPG